MRAPLVTGSLVVAALLASTARAQSSVSLTLQQARARAESAAFEVRLSTSRVAEAEATRVGAGVWLPTNPMVNFDTRYGGAYGWGYGGAVNVLFDGFGAPSARLHEAEQRVGTALAEAQRVRLDAQLLATRSYVGTSLARIQMNHARESIALAASLVDAARERQKAGAGSAVDVTSAEAELAERKAQLQAAIGEETLEQLVLRQLAGIPVRGDLTLESSIDDPPEAPTPEELLALAREAMPDLKVAYARLALLEASNERLGREALPKLGGYLGIDTAPASPSFGMLGLQVELPVAQRNQGPRAVNVAEQRTERTRIDYIIEHLELQVFHHRTAHEAARAELHVLVTSGIPNAAERLRLVEEGWRAGRFDVFKVTTAANDLVRLKATRVDVLKRIWTQRLELERLIGGWGNE